MISPMEINEQFKLWFYCIYFLSLKFMVHFSQYQSFKDVFIFCTIML